MKSSKGSIKKDIFSKSLIIIILATTVLMIGIYGLIMANQFLNTLIPMNNTVVEIIKVNSHFKSFENNMESYLTIRDEDHKIKLLKELDSAIQILIDIDNRDYSDLVDKCNILKSNLNRIFNRETLSSLEENETIYALYNDIFDINDHLLLLLDQIPKDLQLEAYNYKVKSNLIVISYGVLALVIVIFYIYVGFRLSVSISKPIENLTNSALDIINGDMQVRANTSIDNEIGTLAETFNDMTSRLQNTLLNLKESEHKYRTLFEREGDAIIIFNPDNGMILDVNSASTTIYGYKKEEMKGMLYSNLLDTNVDETRLHSNKYDLHKKKDGSTFPAEVNYYDITLEKKSLSFIVSRDITEKLKIEEMLIQSEKMMSIGGLAAGMAHEINNPLSSIISLAELILMRLTKNDLAANIQSADKVNLHFEDLEQYIEERGISILLSNIIDSGKKIDEIIKSMLNFSRKDNMKKSYNSISTIIEDTLKLAKTNKYFKNVNVIKDIEPHVPEVLCDHNKIEQVLFNILNNGIQAMVESKIVNPEFLISVFLSGDKRYIVISIKDNGEGIDNDIKKRIFEPFFTTKGSGKGTGLGLSISYFIVTEYHGGEMSVESSKGMGATFFVRLPLA